MKEGNEPTRWRVLICICLKWQVREQEKGCSSLIRTFSPSAEDEGTEELRATLLSETSERAYILLPVQTGLPPPPHSLAEGSQRKNYRQAHLKDAMKIQEKHASSARCVSSPFRQLGFNSTSPRFTHRSGERMRAGRERALQQEDRVSGS